MNGEAQIKTRGARAIMAPGLIWLSVAVILVVTQYVSNRVLPHSGHSMSSAHSLRELLDGWAQYDGHDYMKIAASGYSYTPGTPSNIVWFPAYPLCIRVAGLLIADTLVAAVVVSAVAGLGSAVLYWTWLGRSGMSGRVRVVAYLMLMLYPYAWYLYGVVYADSIFLLFVLASFVLLDRGRFVLAGVFGALATATRPTGLAAIAGLTVMALESDGVLSVPLHARGVVQRFKIPIHFDRSRLRLRTLAPLLSVLGVAAYSLYLGARFDAPFAWLTNQDAYHPGGSVFLKRPFFAAWRDIAMDPVKPWTVTAQLLFALVVLWFTPAVGRRFGWGYAVLCAVTVAIPSLGQNDVIGTGRYLIAAFPVAALIGEQFAHRRRGIHAWLSFSFVALVGLNMAFSRSWYLS